MKKLRYIKDLIWKNKYKYITGILCLLIVDFLQLLFPKFLGIVTDVLKAGDITKEHLFQYVLIISLIAFGIALFRFFWRYLVLGTAKSIETTLRERFYAHLQKLSANYYNHHKTGDLMAHATNDIGNVTTMLGQGVALAVDSAIIPLAAIVMMFYSVGAKLTLACFSPLILLALVLAFNVKLLHQRVEKMQQTFSSLTERVRESFSGIRVIKSFAQEQKEIKKFEEDNRHNKTANLKYVRVMSMLFPTVMSISALSFAVALWYGGILVIYGEITLGDFIAFNGYLLMLIWPTAALGWILSLVQRGFVSLERINTIMDEPPEIMDQPLVPPQCIGGNITFKNVSFIYPGSDRPALSQINLFVDKGKTLAIVGRTGSGKTTLANLLVRLFDITEGEILIDGHPIQHIPLQVLRSQTGYVPQDTFLFSATIKENIDFFHRAEDAAIQDVSKISRVYDTIMDFPQGFETFVGERGITLSGGQKQRIAIARAILREPSILILDDCLSAVDAQTEEEILKGLKKVMRERTSIVISHRVSAIKEADEIIVLDQGRIIERGNHESLMALQGVYYDLYQKQILSERLEVEE
ncbi:MAG: ABC transporter ATP-binding protein/permease [Clostridia bacterium]|nr:ABC transporter ATP-binding protein/permease [Clostridia bacterium]